MAATSGENLPDFRQESNYGWKKSGLQPAGPDTLDLPYRGLCSVTLAWRIFRISAQMIAF
jgi:hypothetical protein